MKLLAVHFTLLVSLCLLWSCDDDDEVDPNVSPTVSVCDDFSQQIAIAEEGLIVIEAENTSLSEGWTTTTAINGFTGDAYIVWEGEQSREPGEFGINTYQFRIATPGTYRIQLRSRITNGEDNTENNDAWIKIPEADDFFARKMNNNGNTSIAYPVGSGNEPEAETGLRNIDGWFKSYMNRLDEWTFVTNTYDRNAHQIFATFDEAGDYTFQLAGRSPNFGVDRIVLYLTEGEESVDTDTATDIAQPASEVTCE
ncbi:MAG: hypothetical protein ACFB0B_11300 [Thermonemataceae bacterium]